MQQSAHPILALVIIAACVAFIAGIPITLILIVRRKQAGVRQALLSAWSGVVTDIEVKSMAVGGGTSNPRRAAYLRLHYRTSDGQEGHVDIDGPDSGGAVMTTTLAPAPPDGYYEHVQTLREGDAIVKDAGQYYPRRA